MRYKRIHIVGGTGSGKTTLGKKYSKHMGVPSFKVDTRMFYHRGGSHAERSSKQRESELEKVVTQEQWVIEGVFYKWLTASFDSAEIIIVLEVSRWIRAKRIMKRFMINAHGDQSDFKCRASRLIEILKFNHTYDKEHYVQTLEMLRPYQHKLVICKTEKAACAALGM